MNNDLDIAVKAKILLVDDKIENLIALEKTLAPLHLEVFKATSGNEALKLVLNNDFAVILLDVMMPIMDGFEVAGLIHQNEITRNIPIVFLTASSKSEKYYIQGMEVGAIDYLYKPVEPVILLSKVKVFVDLYQVKNQLEQTIADLHTSQAKLEESNKKLKQLSEEDTLTKISNRRYFESEFSRLLAATKKDENMLALIFCDVDDFKNINDKYGHRAGDYVLQTIAERIKKIGEPDEAANVVPQLEVVARVGGDEFAVILSGLLNNSQNAMLVGKQILRAITATPFICHDVPLTVSVSLGIACYPETAETIPDLLRAADLALYQAKEAGKNQCALYKDV